MLWILKRTISMSTKTNVKADGKYPTKKRNAPLRTVQLSGRSQVIGRFSLYQCKGMPGTAA